MCKNIQRSAFTCCHLVGDTSELSILRLSLGLEEHIFCRWHSSDSWLVETLSCCLWANFVNSVIFVFVSVNSPSLQKLTPDFVCCCRSWFCSHCLATTGLFSCTVVRIHCTLKLYSHKFCLLRGKSTFFCHTCIHVCTRACTRVAVFVCVHIHSNYSCMSWWILPNWLELITVT